MDHNYPLQPPKYMLYFFFFNGLEDLHQELQTQIPRSCRWSIFAKKIFFEWYFLKTYPLDGGFQTSFLLIPVMFC